MNRVHLLVASLAVAGLAVHSRTARGQSGLPPQLQKVGFDQRLGEQVPLDTTFVDESGHTVQLGKYFHGKPVILVMAYYRCPMLCTLVLNGLVQGMLDMSFDVGNQFEVVTVSFDPRETPDLAAAKKQTYVSRYGRPGAAAGWHFLTGKEDSIRRLATAVGFRYVYDSATDQYAHAAGIMIVTPSGKLARYFYDLRYPGRDLRLGLIEASANKIGSPVDQVLLFCFHYDPIAGKYGVAVMNFVRLGGVLTIVVLGAFIGVQFRRERRRRSTQSASPVGQGP
jgi:protein SCO1/2